MAVAVDAVGPSSAGTNGNSPLTWTHTASGSNRAVVVGVSQVTGGLSLGDITVTYGGTSMTYLGARASNDNADGVAWLFGLAAPATGAQTVSVQRSAGGALIAGSVSFTGVDQSTPFGTAVATAGDNSSGSNPPAATVSSASGNMVVDILAYASSINGATGTQQWLKNINNATAANNAAQSTYAGASSVTAQYNPTAHDWWGMVAVNINAASGGGGGGSNSGITAWITA